MSQSSQMPDERPAGSAPGTPLKISSDFVPSATRQGDTVFATLRGEIDLHNSPDLRGAILEILEEAKPARLVLDMTAVIYMDSSAIAVLVEALRRLRGKGGKLVLFGVQPRVRTVLQIARLDTIFVVVNTLAEAASA